MANIGEMLGNLLSGGAGMFMGGGGAGGVMPTINNSQNRQQQDQQWNNNGGTFMGGINQGGPLGQVQSGVNTVNNFKDGNIGKGLMSLVGMLPSFGSTIFNGISGGHSFD